LSNRASIACLATTAATAPTSATGGGSAFACCGVWSVQTEGQFGIVFTLVLIAARDLYRDADDPRLATKLQDTPRRRYSDVG
jgi:hypothetical protein